MGAVDVADKRVGPAGFTTWLRRRETLAGVIGPLVAIVVLMVVFTALESNFLTTVNLLNIVRQSAVLLVLALAGTFIILMGSIDLSVGSIVTLTGICGAIFLRDLGELGVLLILPIGLACGLINGALFAYAKLPSFLVTLGTLFAFNGLALYICEGRPIAVVFGLGIDPLFSGDLFGEIPAVALWALGVWIVCVVVAKWTTFGRYIYAIGGGERVAELSGVPVKRYKLLAFMFGGLLAGIAGLLLLFRINSGSPEMGEPFLLTSIAAVVMGGTALTGGVGGPHRTMIGVIIISILSNGMNVANVDPFLQVVVQGVVVIAAVSLTVDRSKLQLVK
jgi:ribose/xylose/arabinose/galactoside ABC-type transport system permease subunit